jgi:MFS family permease
VTRTGRLLANQNYKWVVVALLFVCGFLNLEDRVVIFSILPLIRRDLHLTDVQTGGLMTAFLWTYAAFSPFTGYFGDRISRRHVILWSVCAWSIVTVWAGAITSTGQLFATRFMLGFTESFYLPTALALLADWHGRRTRGRAVSTLIFGMNLGPILGGTFAGYVGENYGWRVVLYALGGIGIVHTFMLLLFLREAPPGAAETDGPLSAEPIPVTQPKPAFFEVLRTLVSIPSFVCLGIVSGLNAVAIFMLNTWFPVFLYDTYHVNLTQSAFLGNFVLMAPVMAGTIVGGFISDKVGGREPRYRLLMYAVCLSLTIPWPLLFWLARNLVVVLLAIALFGLFRSLGECNWHPVMYELVPPSMRSTATGITNSFNCLMGGVGSLVGGYYRSTLGLQGIFGLISVLIAMGVCSLLFSYFFFLRRDMLRAQVRGVGKLDLVPESAHTTVRP